MSKKTVLIIDDEPDFVEMIRMRLESNDYNVLEAFDGETGYETAKKDQPGLILLDIMMPKLDGFGTLRKLKGDEETDGINVVMLTAKGESTAIFKAQGLGANDYLLKPCDPDDLQAAVQKFCRA